MSDRVCCNCGFIIEDMICKYCGTDHNIIIMDKNEFNVMMQNENEAPTRFNFVKNLDIPTIRGMLYKGLYFGKQLYIRL